MSLFLICSALAFGWHRHYESISNCDVNTITANASNYVGNIEDVKVSHTKNGCIYTVKGNGGIAKFDNDGDLIYYKKKKRR